MGNFKSKINRKGLFLLICLTMTMTSFAQWNVKGGMDFSSLAGSEEVRSEVGFHLGVAYDIPFSSKFYFQPGMLFVSNGFDFRPSLIVKKASVSMYALEVPLNFSYRPQIGNNIKLITELGFYARCGLFGNKDYVFVDGEKQKESSYHAYNRCDAGVNLGIGLAYKKVSLICAYQHGFTKAEKDIDKLKHRKVRVSINYLF